MSTYSMTIAGQAELGSETFPVLNPATEEVYAHAPACSREQLDRAMSAAQAALANWSRDAAARSEALLRAAEVMDDLAAELVPVLTAEQGKSLGDSGFEMTLPGRWFRHVARLELPSEVVQEDDIAVSTLHRQPIGVVAGISSWNFPVYQVVEKVAPALAAGNTIVLKPSPYTPLTTLLLGEALRDVFPPGVMNIVSGGDELGEWMTHHPVPRMIAFTGSIETGEKIAAAAARGLKRLKLELGGNDAAIVLDDADLDTATRKIFWSAFVNCGQVCNAIKRVYAHEDVYDDLVEGLAAEARAVRIGDGTAEGTQLGPINNRRQFERVKELTAEALRAGATAAAGGGPRGGRGYFFEPTILSNLSDGVRVVDEEQFGPVLPVVAYSSVDDAVHRANNSPYGISASVWTSELARATELARELDVQTVHINAHMIGGERIPYGGVKSSGIGVANGLEGFLGYTETKVINEARGWAGVELPSALEAGDVVS